MKAFIIHGTGGSPEGNWFPWLKSELEKLGYEVFVPRFPEPEKMNLDSWMGMFGSYLDKIDENTMFVAHSLGPAFVLSVLEKIHVKVKACFFVAGFVSLLNNDFDKFNKTFVEKDFDWDKIKNNCSKFVVINSKDDPYVPFEEGEKLAGKLGAELIALDKAGHINAEFGFKKFGLILEKIKKAIRE